MSDSVQQSVWQLLVADSDVATDAEGNKIVVMTLLLRAHGKNFAVAVSGPDGFTFKDAFNTLRAASAHTLSMAGIDPSSVMKDTAVATSADARGNAPLNG